MFKRLLSEVGLDIEFLVMPFRLSNAPATFIMLMNDILRSFIGKFVVHFIDDILVYNKSVAEHREHLREVFTVLRRAILFANKKKTELCLTKLVYLRSLLLRIVWKWIRKSYRYFRMASAYKCNRVASILRIYTVLSKTYQRIF